MNTLTATLRRSTKTFVVALAALALALAALVVVAPAANAVYTPVCGVRHDHPTRGTSDVAMCKNFPPNKRGVVRIRQHVAGRPHHFNSYVVGHFTTRGKGQRIFIKFRIPRALHDGHATVIFRAGRAQTRVGVTVIG
ncbi:MAG: hypothetical protein INR66_17155 [Gordonia polyisoprenivorans]|nr:hypothetical protein [Gordonia polyisoprenivorans]